MFKRKDPVEAFQEKVKSCKTKEEQRTLEMQMLKPTPIANTFGKKPTALGVHEHAVKFYFNSDEHWELLQKHFYVSFAKECCVRESINIFYAFLEALESGKIKYDKRINAITTPYDEEIEENY